jgi:hypothetical protein
MKRFLIRGASSGGKKGGPKPPPEQDGGDEFPKADACLMIFGGPTALEGRRQQKVVTRAVHAVEPAVPQYLRWSEEAITFDRKDHPAAVPHPGRFPLVVEAIVGGGSDCKPVRLTKVFMDGGSGLNLLYTRTLDAMGVSRSLIRPSKSPFFGIVPGVQAVPMGQIDLPVTFGDAGNFRTEILTFEVVDFEGSYHAILGRPCYAKFMAVPNYTYLKLKMPGPGGVITVGSKASRAHECDKENCELAERAVAKAELRSIARDLVETAPDSRKPSIAGSFKPTEDSKTVQVDPQDPSKTVRIGTELDPK